MMNSSFSNSVAYTVRAFLLLTVLVLAACSSARTVNYDDVDVSSLNTHGTQLAGIIAAAKNDVGTQGVAYNAEILAIKALGEDYHTVNDIALGIDYAVANGAAKINRIL